MPELTRTIYGSAHPRHTIADLAKLVVNAADAGDEDAMQILDQAAADLAHLAARTARSVGLQDAGLPLAASGGVLANSSRVQQQLRIELAKLHFNCELNVVDEPLSRLCSPRRRALRTPRDVAQPLGRRLEEGEAPR